jgi:hypothetical protein
VAAVEGEAQADLTELVVRVVTGLHLQPNRRLLGAAVVVTVGVLLAEMLLLVCKVMVVIILAVLVVGLEVVLVDLLVVVGRED